jgi:hypothetical protein
MMYDSEPSRLTSPSLAQDFQTHDSDMFVVALDTYLDRLNSVLFGVNPAGALVDIQTFNDSRYNNRAWEGVVTARTVVHEWGWSAEMAIPFTTLRFENVEGPQDWGVNFMRRVRRLNEDSYWSPLSRQYRVHKMSRAGTLTGLENLEQGRNLTLKPYVTGSHSDGLNPTDLGDDGLDGALGFDMKYGVTSAMTLDLTVNTDFSQVEVDQEQVNLTRFSLFFPEKRDFFMEGEGTYNLGDVAERNYRTGSGPNAFKLFHSRRIGLSADRRPIPILGGARLTGRLGGSTELGLLNMQTRSYGENPAENFAVVRLRRNVFNNGDIGAMFVNRQATEEGRTGEFNRSLGVDANLRFGRFLIFNGYLAATDDWELDGNSRSGWAQLAWRDPLWDVSAYVKQVGEAFSPDVGFVQRTNIRQAFATVGAHPQPGWTGVQEVNPYLDWRYTETVQGELESRSVKGGVTTMFIPGDQLVVEYEDRFERLLAPETIVGVELPAGDYAFGDLSARLQSSGARTISGTLRSARGDFFDGDKTTLGVSALFRPSARLSFEGTVDWNDLTLGGEKFTANVYGGKVNLSWSTRAFASAFVQYNETADELVTNVRFNFIHAPLSDVFLVFQERRDLGNEEILDRLLTLKVTKLFAF